jgi:nucleotide-binding universal stress UspA family protein
MVMNNRILVGIDADLSPQTQYALRVASELLEESSLSLRLVLLHVIPTISDTQPTWGKSLTAPRFFPPTTMQRVQAVQALQRARSILQQWRIAPERVTLLQRAGSPPDEIIEVARELLADFIVIGSRGASFAQRLRRMVTGSTSRRVLQLAPCPIMVVTPPRMPSPRRLEDWYREAVKRSLEEHPERLKVFTACDVAQWFAPPNRKVGSKEVEAATHALEELAHSGVLCSHKVKGEMRYLND